jgi:hypothetical protein
LSLVARCASLRQRHVLSRPDACVGGCKLV